MTRQKLKTKPLIKKSYPEKLNEVLIVSLSPYFINKPNFWFQQNLNKILEVRKTQSFFEDNTFFCEKNQIYNFSRFLRKLDEMGYEKVQRISDPGEFAVRGGIVDVFPVNSKQALRFEFLGNKIENIEKLAVEIKDEESSREFLKKKLKSQELFSDLRGIKSGDYLVHLDHGIARFSGLEKLPSRPAASWRLGWREAKTQNYYLLEYAQNDKLYVPLGLEKKLSRYIGFVEPKISRLGSPAWQRIKTKIKKEAENFAKELLEIYAKREIASRPPYLPDSEIDKELSSGFVYEETPDQSQAIEEIKKDLEKSEPMDRLICGDVGFGKTEVALRAMVKAVGSDLQVAMLCPTTILAHQHYQNFKKRVKNLPIKIAILTRLQTKKEQKEIIENLNNRKIDIVVGTHRLLSKDVQFKKLGLLIIDDEQRFGVSQKEKFKKLRTSLDILSLSATPIPRTLYLALSSLKNISLIQTPPTGRLAVKTNILPWGEEIIKKAIESEIGRGGQVYYLHNRVETIETVKKFLENLHPAAQRMVGRNANSTTRIRFGIAHGRLKEKELVKVMDDFRNKKIDVLIATTIIEAGLDLPNVNTLIVADATRLGLAQAYQIRGRVGRSHIQSFAYFLYGQHLLDLAKERLKTLKEAETLGSGYRIALKDLEIRGAGNILGKEQSGNINRVGLNLYCQMLSQAIEKMK